MKEIKRKDLINGLEKAIKRNELGAFIGAGLSVDAGFPTWRKLLEEPAEEIGLRIKEENDLISLAQYYSNTKRRTAIDELIRSNFAIEETPTQAHDYLAKLPITTFWTTNYDKLIERALKANMKKCIVKTEDAHLRESNSNYDAIVYKMHGDAERPEDAVITRSDYEKFGYDRRRLFREVLEGDLLTKTFLFLGVSFSDPNFNQVIGRLRVMLDDENARTHYCIMKKINKNEDEDEESFVYRKMKQQLQIEDLSRYGIDTHLVDDYSEITNILQDLVHKYQRKTIFISGSADSYPIEGGGELIHSLAFSLVKNGYSIVNGYGKGVGEFIVNGVAEYCLTHKGKRMRDVLTIMPFPQNVSSGIDLKSLYKENRDQMIETCGIALFLFGNKEEVAAKGVLEEYEMAREKGLICLPVNYTGGASEEIYGRIINDGLSDEVKKAIQMTNKGYSGDISEAVTNIINAIKLLNKEEV